MRFVEIGGLRLAREGELILGEGGPAGWYSTPGIKTDSESREAGHGSYQRRAPLYSARTVSIPGVTIAGRERHVELWEAFNALHQTEQVVRVADRDDTFVTAVLETDFPSRHVGGGATFSVVAVADDPVRRSWEVQEHTLMAGARRGALDYPVSYPVDYVGTLSADVSQSATVTNAGNHPAFPVIEVRGDLRGGFTLTDSTGRVIRFDLDVLASAPVTIDCERRTAIVGGVNVSWALSFREWFDVPAGGDLMVTFLPAADVNVGQAWATLRARSAWI